ncbi:hypothetical protein GF402_03670 [Candidatus Fermentibacteria bacterium]|nr:hypothetical protein [Candidatus Fermentibacteria bacterium]
MWYAKPNSRRTAPIPLLLLTTTLIEQIESKTYRNPVIYAQEIRDEMKRLGLTRREMGKRLGVSSDRITQWLCLLKLPEAKLREIDGLGDYWGRTVITERELRRSMIDQSKSDQNTTT